MRNTVPVVVLVLVALSMPISAVGTAGAGSASASPLATVDDGTTISGETNLVRGDHAQLDDAPNRLVIHGETRTSHATPTLDFSYVAASQDESIRTDQRAFAFETDFEALEDEDEREAAAVAELERLEDRVEELRERENDIVSDHADGEVTDDELLRALASSHAEAEALKHALDRLDAQVGTAADVSGKADNLADELTVYTDSLRGDIDAALRGADDENRAAQPYLLETGEDGLVVATITDDENFVREATRYDNRDPDGTEWITAMDEAREETRELYPWAFDTTDGTSTIRYSEVQLFQVQATSHDQGYLSVYLDGSTEQVFHEHQTLDLNRVPLERAEEIVGEDVTAAIDHTADTAPASIVTVETDGGEPADTTVRVDGTVMGETGADGELWFVPPSDDYELAVTTDSNR
ncbi:DUF7096 domain-containing protein [Natronolimnohabitans innermongolicus]|uniref:Uncharacterized protein n=1 Tax=Natronolimnohabitans innermongolicus JCM 12255 TaxID=1227499 RepID=L9WWS0_9EURY|nr:hypothetical protein [Natronolimnohabitans innermongolicus]ELY53626.1 hypothetical protein C493_13958 [Natronolimnohabitans innermongolicus JCM 12255]